MITEHTKHFIDMGSAFVVLGTLFDALPKLAAGFAILWYCTRLWDWWRGRKEKSNA